MEDYRHVNLMLTQRDKKKKKVRNKFLTGHAQNRRSEQVHLFVMARKMLFGFLKAVWR